MKNSAAVPSGAAEKRRDLTKLMPIIFARYLASLTVYVASSRSAPLTHSLPFIRLFNLPHLSRSTPVGSIHHALLCRSTRRVMSSGSQARILRPEAASLFASRSREADDSVLVNGARGTRDIEGKVMRVGASELGANEFSKPSAPAMLATSLLQGEWSRG